MSDSEVNQRLGNRIWCYKVNDGKFLVMIFIKLALKMEINITYSNNSNNAARSDFLNDNKTQW